ncbi:hypothetical protein BC833DRAFT_583652 [Globomyces pollinis-pini]|nr:hypothetical protein BC833DRAFT_583652 [Globomyces pollinis-pini]
MEYEQETLLRNNRNWKKQPALVLGAFSWFLFLVILTLVLFWQTYNFNVSFGGFTISNFISQFLLSIYITFNPIILSYLAMSSVVYSLQMIHLGPQSFAGLCAIADKEWANPILVFKLLGSSKTASAWSFILLVIYSLGLISSFLTGQVFRASTCLVGGDVDQDIPATGPSFLAYCGLETYDSIMYADSAISVVSPRALFSNYLYKNSDGADFWGPDMGNNSKASAFGLYHDVSCSRSNSVPKLQTSFACDTQNLNLKLKIAVSTDDSYEVDFNQNAGLYLDKFVESTINFDFTETMNGLSPVKHAYTCKIKTAVGNATVETGAARTASGFSRTKLVPTGFEPNLYPAKSYFNVFRDLCKAANSTASPEYIPIKKLLRSIGYADQSFKENDVIKFSPVEEEKQKQAITDGLIAAGALTITSNGKTRMLRGRSLHSVDCRKGDLTLQIIDLIMIVLLMLWMLILMAVFSKYRVFSKPITSYNCSRIAVESQKEGYNILDDNASFDTFRRSLMGKQ